MSSHSLMDIANVVHHLLSNRPELQTLLHANTCASVAGGNVVWIVLVALVNTGPSVCEFPC